MEEVIHNLSISMLTYGCEPYVFAPYVRGENNKLDVPYKVLRYQRPSSRRFGVRQILVPLLWYHLKYRFDIIHCHGVYPPGYVAASFYKITGVPFIITPHGGDLELNDEGDIINHKVTNRIRKTFSSAQAVTAISSDIKNRVIKLGAPQDKIHFIPNGVFVDDFKAASICHENKSLNNSYILYLGGLKKIKGIDILLKAFSIIKKDYPDLKLKIAGDGREADNLKRLAQELGINRDVDFLGIVQGNKKIELLKNALFLVCPSMQEAFGIVNLEAFASGIPAIASRVGGIPDIIIDGENGFLVEPAKVEQLAEKMNLLIQNDDLRKKMVENALISILKYDWSNIVKKYVNIYEELIVECKNEIS